MSAHTPGPWHVGNGEIYDAEYRRIAFVGQSHRVNGHNGAHPDVATIENARLIASAPTMLEFVKRIAGHSTDPDGLIPETVIQARAILRDVEGEK